MLRIYRAPATEPGHTTLQADAGTWRTLRTALVAGATADGLRLGRIIDAALTAAGQSSIVRVSVPTSQAQVVLDLAARQR